MSTNIHYLDLRTAPPGMPAHTYAFYALRELERGMEVILVTEEDPALLLNQLQLQLRNRLRWTCVREQQLWKVSIRQRQDTEAVTLQDILSRDHERLDGSLVQTLTRLRTVGAGAAAAEGLDFLQDLRRHIGVENDVLAPAFPSLYGPQKDNPVTTMLREHQDILRQAALIEELFQEASPDTAEAEIWFGLLAAALSKHEHREETRLFPLWEAQLGRCPEADHLILQVRTRLALPEAGAPYARE